MVGCTALIFIPAGIAASHEQGFHFPESRFDNNLVASTILGGWMLPTAGVFVASIVRIVLGKLRGSNQSSEA